GKLAADIRSGRYGLIEAVGRVIETVGPNAELGIVVDSVDGRLTGQARIGANGIEIPAVGNWVRACRSSDAFVKRWHGVAVHVDIKGEVGEDPPVRQRVVDHNRVATAMAVAEGS